MSLTVQDDAPATARERARPMPPDERRAAMVRCVIPLLKEHGRAVSTRAIAEACGVAEGTVFRAFGDKESLIAAAIEAYFDPGPFREAIGAVDRSLPVEEKLAAVLGLLKDRFSGIVGFMSALGMHGRPRLPDVDPEETWLAQLEHLLEPDLAALAVPPELIGHYLRLVALASSIPHFSQAHAFGTDELLRLVTRGVLAPEGDA